MSGWVFETKESKQKNGGGALLFLEPGSLVFPGLDSLSMQASLQYMDYFFCTIGFSYHK